MTALALDIPVLETERLILRGPEARDFEPIAAFYADEARSWGYGGPFTRAEAWRWFAASIGHWLQFGYGFWIVDTRAGHTLGMAGLWSPEGWPEPELAWAVFAAADEGKGYAREAALAVRAHAYTTLGWTTLASNILAGNDRSVALAERLGAVFEKRQQHVTHGTEMVYRHPAPAALTEARP